MKKTTARRTGLDSKFNLVSDLNNQTPPPSAEKSVMDAYKANVKQITKLHNIFARATKLTTKYAVFCQVLAAENMRANAAIDQCKVARRAASALITAEQRQAHTVAMNNYHDALANLIREFPNRVFKHADFIQYAGYAPSLTNDNHGIGFFAPKCGKFYPDIIEEKCPSGNLYYYAGRAVP
ncbi:MAG: hypothetical protein GY922_18555 [Proteobacteria bacterium]|nr:hypothetical protein [Pseudomonadota bacterium]